jgi:hypothetical protein
MTDFDAEVSQIKNLGQVMKFLSLSMNLEQLFCPFLCFSVLLSLFLCISLIFSIPKHLTIQPVFSLSMNSLFKNLLKGEIADAPSAARRSVAPQS